MIKISEDERAAAPRPELEAILASTHDAAIGSAPGLRDQQLERIVGGEPDGRNYTAPVYKDGAAVAVSHQVLALARREVVQPLVLNLNGVVVTEVEELPRRTVFQGLELVTGLLDSLGPILAGPDQIKQVPVNFAINSRDAMPGSGTLRIETANVVIDADSVAGGLPMRPGRHVRLAP